MYLVTKAPIRIKTKDKCNNKTAHFSFLYSLYLKIFPEKLITKNTMMASNHLALYIHILAVSVLYQLSIKVPNAMAMAKTINKTAVNRVEKNIFLSVSVIMKF